MTATVHYEADFAAQGGPGWSGPSISPERVAEETTGAMVVQFEMSRNVWIIVDSGGNVYAEAKNPADLAGWMAEYLASMGRMHDRGEL